LTRYAAAVLASAIVAVAAPAAAPTISADALERLAQIRAEVHARYRGLRVSGFSSTSAIDSLTTFDGVDPGVVSADNGICYAVWPSNATRSTTEP